MKRIFWRRALIFLTVLTGLTSLQAAKVQAQNPDPFTTNLATTITVSESGQNSVTHQFTITNNTPTTFLSQYGLQISSAQLSNIQVTTPTGESLNPEIVTVPTNQSSGPGQTSIGITFDEPVVGQGKSRVFTISYINPDVAIISGSVLEVTLPQKADPELFDAYSVKVISPARFGPPVRSLPEPISVDVSDQVVTTLYNRESSAGVFTLYGDEQYFDLELSYFLENTTNNQGYAQIALPPDTAFQHIKYHQLDPKPDKIEADPDGNWIATYYLAAGTQETITAAATAWLTLDPNQVRGNISPQPAHTQSQPYWPLNNPSLVKLANEHTSPTAINTFVVDTLSYNTQRALTQPDRLGAATVIDRPQDAVCQEYTDLFVSLARINQIPARRVTGYAYTQNSELRPLSLVDDVLHAWPEYYDDTTGIWLPIDPTWEDTTGGVDYFEQRDLNHITFAINGVSSESPYPAGSYKQPDSTVKTVNVSFGQTFEIDQATLSAEIVPKKIGPIPIPFWYEVVVTNPAGHAIYDVEISAAQSSPDDLYLSLPNQGRIPVLLPYQELRLPTYLGTDSLTPKVSPIKLDAPTNPDYDIIHQSQQLLIGPGGTNQLLNLPNLGIIAVVAGGLVSAGVTGGLLVLGQARHRALRR